MWDICVFVARGLSTNRERIFVFFFVWVVTDQDSQDMDTDLCSILPKSLLPN